MSYFLRRVPKVFNVIEFPANQTEYLAWLTKAHALNFDGHPYADDILVGEKKCSH